MPTCRSLASPGTWGGADLFAKCGCGPGSGHNHPMRTPTILSISSQVVYGHVGNSAIVPALQALGCEVLALPTVLLAHHPGHGPPKGRSTPGEELASLLDGLDQVGALAGASAMLSGYLGRAENALVAADAIVRLRKYRAGALYLCDPVIGDDGRVYVSEGVEDAIRTHLVPLANVLTPNHFELERLSGQRVTTLEQALAAARALLDLGPRVVVVTSLQHAQLAEGQIATLAVTAHGAWIATTPRLQGVPRGSGDLVAGLLLGRLVQGASVVQALALAASAVHEVLAASTGEAEMRLIEQRAVLLAPPSLAVRQLDEAA